MAQKGTDAFVTFNLQNVRYLTGYTGTNGAALVTGARALFFTDFRYAEQVEKEVPSMHIRIAQKALADEVGEELSKAKAKRTAYEDRHVTVRLMAQLQKSAKTRWVPCGMVEELRMVKDAGEIALLEKNFALLAKTFSGIGEIVVAGRTENQAAAELEYRLMKAAGGGPAFDFIIASGPRSAMPHGVASGKKMKKGEPVVVDWGWVVDGYHSDNTRTVFLGKPHPKMKEVYDIVLEANRRAIEKARPGVPLKEIDAAARDFITQKGYGKYFGHGTGHGVGLEIHESPTVNSRATETAREGMVFTIEPGIYLPGLGGVRIEDMLVVTGKGNRVFSKRLPK
ncbi:MAG: aminopeptidase P family protein [Nitrospinae bacterium]|nr:aminopeptidase P family protein [Nitrospinota bacterium]